MEKIIIYNFGPLREVKLDLDKKLQFFIGPQASGKSTICRVIYFCKKIRDYTLDFLTDAEQFHNNHPNEYMNNYFKFLTRQFMGCFGKTTHMKRFEIKYSFHEHLIKIFLNEDGYVRFELSRLLKIQVEDLIQNVIDMWQELESRDGLSSLVDNITAMSMMKKQLRDMTYRVFGNSEEVIYIPAGRSVLASMSEQLQNFSLSDMDLAMQEFINLIKITKTKFSNKIPEIVTDYTKTVKGQIKNDALKQAYEIIKTVLRADYTNEVDGEKIYFDQYHWVKLMYGSSGQQEVLWILQLIFIILLEQKKVNMIIEEPEAHLFPVAQRDVVELIAIVLNETESKAIITTHSPYILTSANVLLYANKIETQCKKGQLVFSKNKRLDFKSTAAYKLEENEKSHIEISGLMDKESNMIQTEYIDRISEITGGQLDKLMEKEFENDLQ